MLAVLSKQNKTKQNKTKSNKQNTVKSTMNVITDITVSGYLLQRCLAGSPKLGKKKTAKTYTNTSNEAQKLYSSSEV